MAVRADFRITDRDRGWGAIKLQLQAMRDRGGNGPHVKVGVIGQQAGESREGGITNAELAMLHEFGAPGAGIPERSFLRATFDEKRDQYRALCRKLLAAVVDRKITVEAALKVLGLKVVADVKARIRAGIAPPNSASTIAAKGSNTPLIDTSQLINSIDSQVIMRGAA